MLVKLRTIISADKNQQWYKDLSGQHFTVEDATTHFYMVSYPIEYATKLIYKRDCDILKNQLNKTVIKRIDELFEHKLQQKTGWGRNDVLETYRKCVTEAILEILD